MPGTLSMSAAETGRKREAARWLTIAADDRTVARVCLDMTPPSMAIAAYHCQQSIEKIIKGMLVVAGVHFPKTHDLRTLADLGEIHFPSWRDLFVGSIPLTGWGHAYRYPGLEEEPPPDESELLNALAMIDRLMEHMRGLVAPFGE